MSELFSRIWENFVLRTEGPMHFRFFLQPTVSFYFAIKAAMHDAKNNTCPYFWRFLFSKTQKVEIAKEAWRDIGKVFIAGTILDIIYQLIIIYEDNGKYIFYPEESIIVAFTLAILPYIIFRGLINRKLSLFVYRNKSGKNESQV
jgi:hypothetical protein